MKLKESLLFILLSLLWGTGFIFIKLAVDTITPSSLVAGRLFCASLLLTAYVYISGDKLPKPGRSWIPLFVLGITNCTLPSILIVWGQIYIDSGFAAILGATMPLFTILFGVVLTKREVLTWGKGMGIIIGLAGVVMLIGPDVFKGRDVNVWAQTANIAAAAIYAYAAVYAGSITGMSPVVISAGQVIAGFVTIFPFMLVEAPWSLEISGVSFLAMISLAIFATAIPHTIYFYLLSAMGATKTSMITYVIPVVGVITGMLFLNEQITLSSVLALVLILAGVAGVSGIKLKMFLRNTANPSGKLVE